jgi:hypothetical protein
LLFCTIFSKSEFIFKEFKVYQQIIDHQAYPPRHALGPAAPKTQKRASKLLFVTKQCGPMKPPRIFHPLKHPTAHRFRCPKALGAGPGDQRL